MKDRFKGSYLSYILLFFFSYFAMAAFSSVLSVYLTGIGKTASEMSLIVSSSGLFSFVMVPVVGYLCDVTGRPRMISAAALLVLAASSLLFANTRAVWGLFLLNGLGMSFYSATFPVSERLASSSKYRYGTLRVWGTFGYAAGAQAAGIAVGKFPGWVLFTVVAISALIAIPGYIGAEDPIPGESQPLPEDKVKISSFLTMPHFLLYLAIACLLAGASGVNMNYAPLLLTSLGVATEAVGTVLFFSTLVEIPIIVFSNKYMDRFSGKSLLLVTCGLFLIQYIFYALIASAWAVVSVMVLVKAIASTLMMMIVLKIVRNLVDPRLTITAISVVNSVNNLGAILLQNAGGAIADRSSIQTVYLCLAGLAFLAAILTVFLKVGNTEKVFS